MTPTALMTDLVLAEVALLADGLRARGWRMASAESCTGGRIAGYCTDLAGSSDWFERGFVTYSDAAKSDLLGVEASLIVDQGAVSQAVARAMAEGALRRSAANLTVAVTGIAGPGGGSATKPVGTVWLAWAWHDRGGQICSLTQHQRFEGDRAAVRLATVACALQGLIDRLAETADAGAA